MEWGSTTPGALFTGSRSWRVKVVGSSLTFSEDGQRAVALHLAQLCAVRVDTGVMWATCHFDYLEGAQKRTRKVDGIPNEKAEDMRRALDEATAEILAAFVALETPALTAWFDRAATELSPAAGTFVAAAEIENALVRAKPPATPGRVSWDLILSHAQATSARTKGKAWPTWSGSPSAEMEKRFYSHNEATFKAALQSWLSALIPTMHTRGWIPKGSAARGISRHPAPEWPGRTWKQAVGDASPEITMVRFTDSQNQEFLAHQRKARKQFFDNVEKNPLTDEQIHACVCMDDAVMVVAAAGSGKTSTMVAKTGYALHEGLATPDQILLLAFNRATADEVGERIAEQLKDVSGIEKVRSNTFHAFGIEVIGKATGKKPSLAPWVAPDNPGADIREVMSIVHALSDQDPKFKRDWDLFRTIYGRDVGKWGEPQDPDAYDNGKRGFQTANGDVVKSMEERTIADWLFYHRVAYDYERPYEHETADAEHRQYFPDFFFPDATLYHEHFALNEQGQPPKRFKGYLSGVEWKRQLHAEKGTALVETTSHSLKTDEAFVVLTKALVERGVRPTFDPSRESTKLQPVPEQDVARSFRVFQQHVKNNGLSHQQLHEALAVQSQDGYAERLKRYLALYERIAAEWENRLRAGHFIDFEDMLIQAAVHVESGRFTSPYTIILADEFQDSSRSRIRLLKALAKNPSAHTHLCVVGDDWQGINRFAGSDISVMTEFEQTFEHATRLTLNTTFRCPQDLCDVSSEFIQANPAQIAKEVRTTNPLTKTPMLAFGLAEKSSIPAHVEKQLEDMHRYACEGKLVPAKGRYVTVMLLGRYNDDRPAALDVWKSRFGDRLKIEFRTAHGSKGLEAEYVFVLNVTQGTRGFPSQMQDDPALQLTMPTPDPYPFAEERRLFYVAMTRARKQVRFYTTLGQPSQFLVELVKNDQLTIEPIDGEAMEPCPKCEQGVMQPRQGARGVFLGCSRFPACDYTCDPPDGIPQTPRTPVRSQRIRQAVKAGDACPICHQGVLQQKNGRNGAFLGCSRYRAGCRATANVS